jgi:hypothetical protein
VLIIAQDDNRTCLKVKESFNREFGLYYIPVMPLYRMWHTPEQQACAELLTAVCGYLYVEAGLSYYRDEDTYMFYNYEILNDWVEDDMGGMDEGDYKKQKSALDNAKTYGDFIQAKMVTKDFRQSLDNLIANFKAVTKFERDSLAIAQKTWELWQANPDKNLYSHANNPALTNEADEEDDYYADNNFVGMDEYIGFIGSTNDMNSDSLFRMVNDDFNERPSYQEAQVTTVFNEPMPFYTDQMVYTDQLLELITDLCTLFYYEP